MLGYCELDPKEQTSVKFQSKYKTFYARKCIWDQKALEMAAILSKGDELIRPYMNLFLSNLSILVLGP